MLVKNSVILTEIWDLSIFGRGLERAEEGIRRQRGIEVEKADLIQEKPSLPIFPIALSSLLMPPYVFLIFSY